LGILAVVYCCVVAGTKGLELELICQGEVVNGFKNGFGVWNGFGF